MPMKVKHDALMDIVRLIYYGTLEPKAGRIDLMNTLSTLGVFHVKSVSVPRTAIPDVVPAIGNHNPGHQTMRNGQNDRALLHQMHSNAPS